jgi:hypothetical protein
MGDLIMTLGRFLRDLDAHGADLSRWPTDARIAAERLLATNAQARAAHAAALKLDELVFRHLQQTANTEASAGRVLARLGRQLPRQRSSLIPSWWPAALLELDFTPAWSRCAALAAVAMLGFMVGLSDVGSALTPAPYPGRSPSVSSDSDLSTIVFETDPLSSLRP